MVIYHGSLRIMDQVIKSIKNAASRECILSEQKMPDDSD
jgi:hypothetical protein